jgi:hypothetical protein
VGKYDSSMTRVKPVFDHLYSGDPTGESWLPKLLRLPTCGNVVSLPPECSYRIQEHAWCRLGSDQAVGGR